MSDERKQSLFIVSYQGRGTADVVHFKLRELQKAEKIDIRGSRRSPNIARFMIPSG